MRTARPTSHRSRAAVAGLALAAAAVTALAGAVPAAAAGATTITGTVAYPGGSEPSSAAVVLAWLPSARGFDVSAVAEVGSDGSFSLDELSPRTDYQVSYLDYEGAFASGYYTAKGSLVAKAANASLLKAGATGVTVPARRSAPMTQIGLTLPADGTFPSWSPLGAFVVEPANGRVVGMSGLGGPGSAAALLDGAAGPAAADPFAAAAAAPAVVGEPNVLPVPVTGLLRGGTYSFVLATSAEFTGYYYGGTGRALTRSLAKAGTFTGGTAQLEVLVMAPTATTAPSITGTAKVGTKLTAKAGVWSTPGKASYQWLRNGAPIKGATYSSYTPKAADLGKKIKVQVTYAAKVAGYAPGTAWSKPTALVVK